MVDFGECHELRAALRVFSNCRPTKSDRRRLLPRLVVDRRVVAGVLTFGFLVPKLVSPREDQSSLCGHAAPACARGLSR